MTGSIADMVRAWATRTPHAPAVSVAGGRRLTYGALDAESSRFANAVLARAPGPGARIAFLGRDPATWAVTLAGAAKARAAAVPLNWRLARAELESVVADADPVLTVCEPDLLPLLGLGPARDTVVVDEDACTPLGEWCAPHGTGDPGADPDPEDLAFLFYTSGTTGRPKGVQLVNRNIAANVAMPTPWTLGPGDTVLVPAPMFHVSGSGWLYTCLAFGAHGVFLPDFDPAVVLGLFGAEGVSHALLVPAMMQMLARHPLAAQADFTRLQLIVYGGSPISQAVVAEARAVFGCDLVQSYGMTETNGPITFLGPADHLPDAPPGRLDSAGRPAPGVEVRVVDPATGQDCPTGRSGEVWTRSGLVMAGYRNRPDEQAAAVTVDGWLRTGDAGHLDAAGYLYLTDRIKDMIVSGGENIYPAEVENVLMGHPKIADAAVIGVPHPRWGETPKALLVLCDGAELAAADAISYCRERLAHYKCPTAVELVAQLPRNPSGKVLKRVLRERHR